MENVFPQFIIIYKLVKYFKIDFSLLLVGSILKKHNNVHYLCVKFSFALYIRLIGFSII